MQKSQLTLPEKHETHGYIVEVSDRGNILFKNTTTRTTCAIHKEHLNLFCQWLIDEELI